MMMAEGLASWCNQRPSGELAAALEGCCASPAWVRGMLARRPFADDPALFEAAAACWWSLEPSEWLQAFAAHPRIGDRRQLERRFGSRSGSWSRGEQAGIDGTADAVLRDLAQRNREYEERFGFVFLVCASGKSAEEMLRALRQRLGNTADDELRIAAGEQLKITRLRLQKLAAERSARNE